MGAALRRRLRATAVVVTALVTLGTAGPAAQAADWSPWDPDWYGPVITPCEPSMRRVVTSQYDWRQPFGSYRTLGPGPVEETLETVFENSQEVETTEQYNAGVKAEVLELGAQFSGGVKDTVKETYKVTDKYAVAPGKTLHIQPVKNWLNLEYDLYAVVPWQPLLGLSCDPVKSHHTARLPMGGGICLWYASRNECNASGHSAPSWDSRTGDGGETEPATVTVSRFAFSNGAGVVLAKDGRDAPWAVLNPDGRASAFQVSGNRVGAILDGDLFIKDGLYGSWHKLTGGGDVKSFKLSGDRIAFMNGAGVIFAKDGRDAPWATLNPDGRASDFVLEGNWIGAILDGSFHVKEGVYGSWVAMAGGGDVKKIAIKGNRFAFSNAAGVIFAKDGRDASWATLNPDGRASDFVLEGNWIGAILDGSFHVKEGVYGSWVAMAGGGDVKKIAIKGNRFAFSNAAGVIFAKDGRDASWATLNPDGRATDFVLEGNWIGAVADGSFHVKEGVNGLWTTLAGGGDVKKIGVADREEPGSGLGSTSTGGYGSAAPALTVSRFAFSNGAGVVLAKDGRDAPWAVLNPDGRASAFQVSGNRVGAILDGDLFIKDGLYGSWHKLTGGGDVKSFKLSGDRIAFMNGAGVIFAKDGRDAPWATLNPDGRASDFVLEGNWIGAILDGSFHVKEGVYGSWVAMAGGGDVKKIAIEGNRFAFSNGAGVVFAKDGRDASWATLNPDGRASDFVLEGNWIGAILDGSFHVKDGVYGSWVALAGGGDVKKIAIEGNRFAFSNGAGVVFAKDGRDASWATLNPDGRASDFVLEGNWIGAILDGSFHVKEGVHGNWVTLAGGGDVKRVSVDQRTERR